MSEPTKPKVRCAIYTRKSSEEGLDQDFNSLHAQREASEAYVLSQAGEGWIALPTGYDDGGFSGGNTDRPALGRLLADVRAGKVDTVVVYKIDRLTRSLADFAKIVEIFDAKGVSFVSVTQAFNTTTSMGRLTLNVLLSFAQFEREVTGERIRDKIAASKKKGLWMGGVVPLGYDPNGRTLKINEAEAEQVRAIFRRYLEVRSVHRLMNELARQGVRSKQWTNAAGRVVGGLVMTRGALFHLLTNRLYLGEIPHKDESYPGLHPPIIEPDVFAAVAAIFAENRRRGGRASSPADGAPLVGRIFDANGLPMSPTTAYAQSGRRYRYYVSTSRLKGGEASGAIERLPAVALEALVRKTLVRLAAMSDRVDWTALTPLLHRMDLRPTGVTMTLSSTALGSPHDDDQQVLATVTSRLLSEERSWIADAGSIAVALPLQLRFRGGRSWLTTLEGSNAIARTHPNRSLIGGLHKAEKLARAANISPNQSAAALRNAKGVDDPYERKLALLAFTAPDIQEAILAGRQPVGLTLQQMIMSGVPLDWAEQRRLWGF